MLRKQNCVSDVPTTLRLSPRGNTTNTRARAIKSLEYKNKESKPQSNVTMIESCAFNHSARGAAQFADGMKPQLGGSFHGHGTLPNTTWRDGVPPYPGPTILQPVKVPPPPVIPPDMADKDAVVMLVRSYRGGVESASGQRWSGFRSLAQLKRSRYYRMLTDAVHTLRDLGIAPASWVMFSLEVWSKYGFGTSKQKRPPLPWVFGCARIEQHCDWFFDSSATSFQKRLVFPPAAQDLLKRYGQMMFELRQKKGESRRAVVERYFPDGLYDKLLRRSQWQADELSETLTAKVARGEWVW